MVPENTGYSKIVDLELSTRYTPGHLIYSMWVDDHLQV